jgi:hypothetical protein
MGERRGKQVKVAMIKWRVFNAVAKKPVDVTP